MFARADLIAFAGSALAAGTLSAATSR